MSASAVSMLITCLRIKMLDQWIAFANLVPTLPTVPLSDITVGDLSDNTQLPLQPQKVLYYFFHISSCSIGGVTL